LTTRAHPTYRIGLIGSGALGNLIRSHLVSGAIEGASLSSVFSLDKGSFDELVTSSDIVVEAAGQSALREFGPQIVARGTTLVALSNGVLADDALAANLLSGPGLFVPSAGAIGGFDLIDALRVSGQLQEVSLHTTKVPSSLIQSWMSIADRDRLLDSPSVVNVFTGTARDATRLFPANANVAATLGFRSVGLDRTTMIIDADPNATSTTHKITLVAELGRYELLFVNTPSTSNPKSSELAAFSVLHDLNSLIRVGYPVTSKGK
jgi:aspartate dehydrogenase